MIIIINNKEIMYDTGKKRMVFQTLKVSNTGGKVGIMPCIRIRKVL